MIAIEIKFDVPESLAEQASTAGLLEPQAIVQLIEAELERRQQIQILLAATDSLNRLNLPPLTEAEIEAEIAMVRRARRT